MAIDQPSARLPSQSGWWLLPVTFLAGATLMAFEIVGSRLLVPFFGNSLFVWGSLIGIFLGALSIGYTFGGRVADRYPTSGAFATLLATASVLVAACIIIADDLQRAIVGLDVGVRLNPLIASALLFGPASVLMGMVSPYAVRLRTQNLERVGTTVGGLYGISTAGSIFGTFAAAFWMVESLGTETTILVSALTLGICSLAAASSDRRSVGPLAYALVSIVSIAFVIASGGGSSDTVGSTFRPVGSGYSPVFRAGGYRSQFEPNGGGKLLAQADSQYHRIRIVDYPGSSAKDAPTRIMHFDNSLQAGAHILKGRPVITGAPLFKYLRVYDLLPVIRPNAKRMLFIGLGSGAAVMRMHELRPDVRIDVVELDPEVVRLARRWFDYSDATTGTAKISTYVADGRSWLIAHDDNRYDAIVLDVYFADSIPFHMTTVEFLTTVRKRLARDGVLTANIVGAVEGNKNELLRSFRRTWGEAFGDILMYPIPFQDGATASLREFSNVEFMATIGRGVLPSFGGEAALIEQADLGVPTSTILDARMRGILSSRYRLKLSSKGVPVLTDDLAPVDSLLNVEGISGD